MSSTLSPLIHLIDDDEAVRASLALLIGTVGLRVLTSSFLISHPEFFTFLSSGFSILLCFRCSCLFYCAGPPSCPSMYGLP